MRDKFNDDDVTLAAEKLAPIFANNNWTWEGRVRSPTVLDIEVHIHNLLNALRYGNSGAGHKRVSSGRITILRRSHYDGEYYEEIKIESSVLISGATDSVLI